MTLLRDGDGVGSKPQSDDGGWCSAVRWSDLGQLGD